MWTELYIHSSDSYYTLVFLELLLIVWSVLVQSLYVTFHVLYIDKYWMDIVQSLGSQGIYANLVGVDNINMITQDVYHFGG